MRPPAVGDLPSRSAWAGHALRLVIEIGQRPVADSWGRLDALIHPLTKLIPCRHWHWHCLLPPPAPPPRDPAQIWLTGAHLSLADRKAFCCLSRSSSAAIASSSARSRSLSSRSRSVPSGSTGSACWPSRRDRLAERSTGSRGGRLPREALIRSAEESVPGLFSYQSPGDAVESSAIRMPAEQRRGTQVRRATVEKGRRWHKCDEERGASSGAATAPAGRRASGEACTG